ncbi:kinesin, putative [Trypanosoma equiperdum]|uniref:Kinesin-like protein n=1 Tax=Trypanosoma equiperdum TaxID=5694 RepID=A0A1G4I112_TRYEQ|nr:kinesin, putative [Trypanosoma equiperdum]
MENIRVVVRVRPFIPGENPQQCVTVHDRQIRVGDDRTFAFDKVFDMRATCDLVNSSVGDPLISAFVDGYTVSTIAYGQTGAGKTHTMSRLSRYVVERVHKILTNGAAEHSGLASPGARSNSLADAEAAATQPEFRFSAVEVYNDQISDLAVSASSSSAPRQVRTLSLREDNRCGVFIKGLTETAVDSAEGLLTLIERCVSSRRTAMTQANETSSRSHCLLTVALVYRGKVGRFALVDLAGSERMKKAHGATPSAAGEGHSGAAASRVREGISINSGLLALGNVISALCARKSHVPYRASKLTRLLQPMLSGNSKTTMIACVSPVAASFEETLNTLKYANRVKSLRTTPLQVAAVSSMEDAQRAIEMLHQQLLEAKQVGCGQFSGMPSFPTGDVNAKLEELEEKLRVEQKLTQRLKDDLFNAEYTAMVEVEKRKSLEKRIALLELVEKERCVGRASTSTAEVSAVGSTVSCPRRSAESSDPSDEGGDIENNRKLLERLEAERDELEALKKQKETDSKRLAELDMGGQHSIGCDFDGSFSQENLLRDIALKERHIQELKQRNEEAVWALEDSKRNQEEVLSVKRRLEEDLANAVTKLESTEMEQQRKQAERNRLFALHEERLRKAEEMAETYRRRVEEATLQLNQRQCNEELIQQLQAQIPEMREELNRHVVAVREGQQREQKMAASYVQKVKKMKRQMRETEAQVSRLQVELQKKEREIARVKSNIADRFDRCLSKAHVERKQLLRNLQCDSSGRSSSVQREIDLELRALATIETDLDDLMLERCEMKARLDEVCGSPNVVNSCAVAAKGFECQSRRAGSPNSCSGAQAEASTDYSEALGDGNAVVKEQATNPLVFQTLRRLEEVEDSIDSLQEARKYHLQRVRRLQNSSASAQGSVTSRACELLQRSISDSFRQTS